MDDCRQLASRVSQIRFDHCYREANRSADMLARIGAQQSSSFILYDSPPKGLQSLLDFDRSGLYLNRCCPETVVNFSF